MSKFKTKEEYLNFISAWKYATNAEEAKSKRVVCDHVQYNWNGFSDEEKARFEELGYTNIRKYQYTVPNGGHTKERGWLTAAHYIFYNMMKGRDLTTGFYPKSKRKLQYGEHPWTAFERGAWNLEFIIKDARTYVDQVHKTTNRRLGGNMALEFLKPFNGMITIADLLKLDREELAEARKFLR